MVSRMGVIDKERRGCCGAAPADWDDLASPGRGDWSMLGAGGCGAVPVHVNATPVRFVPIPGALLARLTWRNRRGQTCGLKYVVDGRPENPVRWQEFHRLAPEAADELAAGLDSAASCR